MRRVAGLAVGVALLAGCLLVALYGLFAILYRDHSGGSGDTYVAIAGHDTDAGLVGAIALLIAFFLLLASLRSLTRARRPGR